MFLRREFDHWHPHCPPSRLARVDGRGSYYLNFAEKAAYGGPFDADGIPLTVYGGRIGQQYYAIDICQYALGHYELWLRTGWDGHAAIFLRQADWLRSDLTRFDCGSGRNGLWLTRFDWQNLRAPWPSAMAQGLGISVLVRAYHITGQSGYLEAAEAAYRAFWLPVEEGGITRFDSDRMPFFEEMPTRRPSRILNGFIFAIWGVLDFACITGDSEVGSLYSAAMRGLERYLPRYDIGFWSRYDLRDGLLPAASSIFYQMLHVNQLTALYRITGCELYARYAERWRGQLGSVVNRMAALVLKMLNEMLSAA